MNNHPLRFLKPGDNVRILCTARSASALNLAFAMELLEQWGFKVSLGNTIGLIQDQFGGSREERLADFHQAWNDPTVHAIWIARGGYGTTQMVDDLHLDDNCAFAKAEQPTKPIIGYSDVTYLHGKLQALGLPSLHAFMPLELTTRTHLCVESLRNALTGNGVDIELENRQNLQKQTAIGRLYGGNLSILYSMLGSDLFPDTAGAILFIEDIDEYLYHIERMMFSLKRAGKLSGLKALIVGGMTDMNDHEIPFGKNSEQIIKGVCADYDFPIIFNVPAGHLADNRTLILGAPATVKITKATIKINQ
jgi:muramoyltetrapeptide carboxypeptidase